MPLAANNPGFVESGLLAGSLLAYAIYVYIYLSVAFVAVQHFLMGTGLGGELGYLGACIHVNTECYCMFVLFGI